VPKPERGTSKKNVEFWQTDAKELALEAMQAAEGVFGSSAKITLRALAAVARSYSNMSTNLVEAEEMHFETIYGYRQLYGVNNIEF